MLIREEETESVRKLLLVGRITEQYYPDCQFN